MKPDQPQKAHKSASVVILTALGALLSASFLSAQGWASGSGTGGSVTSLLRLRTGAFDPANEPPAAALATRPSAWRRLEARDDLQIIQFISAPEKLWVEGLQGQGITFFDYLPERAYLARVPADRLAEVRRLPQVRSVTSYLPGYRVDPDLMSSAGTEADTTLTLTIHLAPDHDERRGRAAVTGVSRRLSIASVGRHPGALLFEVELASQDVASLLPRLAVLEDLLWIERKRIASFHNGAMRGILQAGQQSSTRLFDQGLTGTGEIVAQSDSGLDVDHCFFTDPTESVALELIDPDAPPAVPASSPDHRKVLAYQYHAGTDTVDDDGHGWFQAPV